MAPAAPAASSSSSPIPPSPPKTGTSSRRASVPTDTDVGGDSAFTAATNASPSTASARASAAIATPLTSG